MNRNSSIAEIIETQNTREDENIASTGLILKDRINTRIDNLGSKS